MILANSVRIANRISKTNCGTHKEACCPARRVNGPYPGGALYLYIPLEPGFPPGTRGSRNSFRLFRKAAAAFVRGDQGWAKMKSWFDLTLKKYGVDLIWFDTQNFWGWFDLVWLGLIWLCLVFLIWFGLTCVLVWLCLAWLDLNWINWIWFGLHWFCLAWLGLT